MSYKQYPYKEQNKKDVIKLDDEIELRIKESKKQQRFGKSNNYES